MLTVAPATPVATPTIIILMRRFWVVHKNCAKAAWTYLRSYFVNISSQHGKVCQVAEDAIQEGVVDSIGP
jgi:hypothetical protein